MFHYSVLIFVQECTHTLHYGIPVCDHLACYNNYNFTWCQMTVLPILLGKAQPSPSPPGKGWVPHGTKIVVILIIFSDEGEIDPTLI